METEIYDAGSNDKGIVRGNTTLEIELCDEIDVIVME